MKLSELLSPETYIYIRVLAKIGNAFKAGDYVRLSEIDYDEYDNPRWMETKIKFAAHRSQVDEKFNFNAYINPVFKVIVADSGYIELQPVNPFTDHHRGLNEWFDTDPFEATGDALLSTISEQLYALKDMDSVSVDEIVNIAASKYIFLDGDYADSLILESEYKPYASTTHIEDTMKRLADTQEAEKKELRRRRAIRGHQTRKFKKAVAEKEKAIALEKKTWRAIYKKLRIEDDKKKTNKKTTKKVTQRRKR